MQKGHAYCHCTQHKTDCSQKKYIKEESVKAQTLEILDDFKIDNPRLLEWVRKALKDAHKSGSKYHEAVVKDLDEKYLRTKNRLDKLYDDKVDGKVSKDFYEQKQEQYEIELNEIVDAKEKHCKANIDYMKLGISLFELAQRGRQIYEQKLLLEEKRELLNFVFSNFKLKDGKITPSLHNGFQTIAERTKDGNWLSISV
jgi:hypothetical protein